MNQILILEKNKKRENINKNANTKEIDNIDVEIEF